MSKVQKYSQTEGRELKVVETQRVVNNLKDSQPLFIEFIKSAGKLSQHLQNEAPYDAVQDSLDKIAEHCGGDIEGAFRVSLINLKCPFYSIETNLFLMLMFIIIIIARQSVLSCFNQLKEQREHITNAWSKNVYDDYTEKDPTCVI